MFRDLVDVAHIHYRPRPSVIVVEMCDEEKLILNKLNELDPRTGLPKNPLAIYRSKDTSPEVRRFIEEHLLQKVQDGVTESALEYDDDDIMDGIPKRWETLKQFDERVSDMLKKRKDEISSERSRKAFEKRMKEREEKTN